MVLELHQGLLVLGCACWMCGSFSEQELWETLGFSLNLLKCCLGEWALAPPGWALHRDAGIQEGGYPPLQAQAGARGCRMLLQAA